MTSAKSDEGDARKGRWGSGGLWLVAECGTEGTEALRVLGQCEARRGLCYGGL